MRKLEQTYQLYDFHLTGIVANAKDYRLAWYLNKELRARFQKISDSVLSTKGISFAFSSFSAKSQWGEIRLLKNRSYTTDNQTAYLLPELNTFDYVVILPRQNKLEAYDQFIRCLGRIKVIQFVKPLDINHVKSKENLIL
ncbi:MAG: IPExxxVDY family protein [Cytophagales bacterium]|nr:IPExxxVDY family protein [Cytophagales bacterium]